MVDDASLIDESASRRFTRVFLVVLLLGIGTSVGLALFVDPLHTFGTGRVPSILSNERDEKPESFLSLVPPPQALVLGTSRVMKFKPSCVAEITGVPAFNFGFSNALVEDFVAIVRFARARSRTPIRHLIIGVDVDSFDNQETDRRLLSAIHLRDYLDGFDGLSWDTATRALFGMQAFRNALSSLYFHVRSKPLPRQQNSADGFVTWKVWEEELKAGTFKLDPNLKDLTKKLEARSKARFDTLSPRRVAMFLELVRSAHAAGVKIDVVMPPLHPAINAARANSPIPDRTRELDALLASLAQKGVVRYLRVEKVEDFGGDPDGFFDGAHMMEGNTTRLLLKMFHRDRGCGM